MRTEYKVEGGGATMRKGERNREREGLVEGVGVVTEGVW